MVHRSARHSGRSEQADQIYIYKYRILLKDMIVHYLLQDCRGLFMKDNQGLSKKDNKGLSMKDNQGLSKKDNQGLVKKDNQGLL